MADLGVAGAEGGAEHAVITRYRLAGDGVGGPSERAAIREAQGRLTEAIERAGVGEFDGNECGGGEAVLYAYGPDAERSTTAGQFGPPSWMWARTIRFLKSRQPKPLGSSLRPR